MLVLQRACEWLYPMISKVSGQGSYKKVNSGSASARVFWQSCLQVDRVAPGEKAMRFES